MIENVFDFNDLTAEDVMIHRTEIVSLWVEDSDEEILRTIEESGLSRFPVYDEDLDDVIGILVQPGLFPQQPEGAPPSAAGTAAQGRFCARLCGGRRSVPGYAGQEDPHGHGGG